MKNYSPFLLDALNRLARLQAIPDDRIVAATVKVYKVFITVPSFCNDSWFFEEDYPPFEAKPPPSWLKALTTGEKRDEGMIFREEIWHKTPQTFQSQLRCRLEQQPDAVTHIESAYNITLDTTFATKDAVTCRSIYTTLTSDAVSRITSTTARRTTVLAYFIFSSRRMKV